jgi:hypothetical protein
MLHYLLQRRATGLVQELCLTPIQKAVVLDLSKAGVFCRCCMLASIAQHQVTDVDRISQIVDGFLEENGLGETSVASMETSQPSPRYDASVGAVRIGIWPASYSVTLVCRPSQRPAPSLSCVSGFRRQRLTIPFGSVSPTAGTSLTDEVIRTTMAFFMPDTQARAFWSLYFFYEARVQWRDFKSAAMRWCCPALSSIEASNLLLFFAQLAGGQGELCWCG